MTYYFTRNRFGTFKKHVFELKQFVFSVYQGLYFAGLLFSFYELLTNFDIDIYL